MTREEKNNKCEWIEYDGYEDYPEFQTGCGEIANGSHIVDDKGIDIHIFDTHLIRCCKFCGKEIYSDWNNPLPTPPRGE